MNHENENPAGSTSNERGIHLAGRFIIIIILDFMIKRFIFWSILAGIALAASLAAHQKGVWKSLAMNLSERISGQSAKYSTLRFRVDLVDRLNYARIAARMPDLKLDPELDDWLEQNFPTMVLDDMDAVTRAVQEALPRYYRLSVCTASGPTLKSLLDEFQGFASKTAPEMTHLGFALREAVGGLSHQALIVVGQRLIDFSPENLTEHRQEAYFSRCTHCRHPHIVRLSLKQHSLGLECPQCRRTYAVVAADQHQKFRYVNEFLTGYAPPAVFSKDTARIAELFTICGAVHGNCIYTRDPGERKEATDAWQTSLETQQIGQGDCEDSSIYLCDWLLARGFQARVVLGRYGDMGGHAWVVVRMNNVEYLLESTESPPDPRDPPVATKVGSRYVPEVMFDRFALYVRTTPGQAWRSDTDSFFSPKLWTRVEPRALNPASEPLTRKSTTAQSEPVPPERLARTSDTSPAAAPFLELEEIPRDAAVWRMSLPANGKSGR